MSCNGSVFVVWYIACFFIGRLCAYRPMLAVHARKGGLVGMCVGEDTVGLKQERVVDVRKIAERGLRRDEKGWVMTR
ncbi:hypothetical protein BKA65DRAFT_119470 [Rhexocercosporidium sp. MPI-PUGE-AT-0058]|nr:hypothetical protein BKA65DRAFT_119470 [Rhexocercosporidium sp. MPI-PUGE-AT-0058]